MWSVQVYAKRLCVDKFGSYRFAFLTLTPDQAIKNNIVVYDPESPQPLKVLPVPSGVLAVAFVPSLTGGARGDLVYFDERLAFNVAQVDEESSKIGAPKPATVGHISVKCEG